MGSTASTITNLDVFGIMSATYKNPSFNIMNQLSLDSLEIIVKFLSPSDYLKLRLLSKTLHNMLINSDFFTENLITHCAQGDADMLKLMSQQCQQLPAVQPFFRI